MFDLKRAWEGDSAFWLDACEMSPATEVWIMDKIMARGTSYNKGSNDSL